MENRQAPYFSSRCGKALGAKVLNDWHFCGSHPDRRWHRTCLRGLRMAKVLSFKAAQEIKNARTEDPEYERKIAAMNKFELLEEMIRFQEERSRVGELTLGMMVRGKSLFQALESSAETRELALLTSSYRRHLEHEMQDYLAQC